MKNLAHLNFSKYDIDDELNVCRKVVERIKKRRSHKEISKNYSW